MLKFKLNLLTIFKKTIKNQAKGKNQQGNRKTISIYF